MIIDDKKIESLLSAAPSEEEIKTVLARARELKGLTLEETALLLNIKEPALLEELFKTAAYIKEEIYGNRLVLFAPLYISNICKNECVYCAFRASNTSICRRALSFDEIKQETVEILKQGHKRVLLVAGEGYNDDNLDYVYKAIDAVYEAEYKGRRIRRVNVNVAPLTDAQFKELARHRLGTYQLFQETYHPETYKQMHLSGPKKDYDYRLSAMDRAITAGIVDVGIGPLFGLYDYRYEVLATLMHAQYLENKYGVGPHTISVPRIEPAEGSEISLHPPHRVSDVNFKKIVAALRAAVPYTGIILSTRESAAMRKELIELGISQMSAGSKTNPGGYEEENSTAQFELSDTRSLSQVISDMVDAGHIPSFCTGCYRLGRVGKDFMDLAKPGLIKIHCQPNAVLTFAEFLEDYADAGLKSRGYALIEKTLNEGFLPEETVKKTREYLEEIKQGKRDIYM